ncbi:calcium-binding protein [Pseudodonghicola sp.]|uniref:calcium-binding protein n=1 Tax=Pseudodonghicola sp. TaxID=1969463 RepID=UPI003A968F4B
MALAKIGKTFTIGATASTPAFAVDGDGGLIAMGTAKSVYMSSELTRYERDGTQISVDVEYAEHQNSHPYFVDTVVLPNGTIVGLYGNEPVFRLFDADGVPLTDFVQVPTVEGGTVSYPSNFAISVNLETGGFSVLVGRDAPFYSTQVVVDPESHFGTRSQLHDTRVVEYDSTGEMIGDPYLANEVEGNPATIADDQTSGGFATLTDGRIVVPFVDTFYYPVKVGTNSTLIEGQGVSFAVIDSGVKQAHTAVYVPPVVTYPNGAVQYASNASWSIPPVAVATSNGGFAILYNHRVDDGLPYIWYAQFYNEGGHKIGKAIDLTATVGDTGTSGFLPVAAMMSDGRIAVVTSEQINLNARDIVLTILDRNGVVDTSHVLSAGFAQGDTGIDDVRVGVDNTIYITIDKTVYRYGLSEDMLQAGRGGETVEGTRKADLIIGSEAGDLLEGGRGHDQIEGHGGRDTLKGAAGNDILLGGDGRDRLEGGGGHDRLNGGEGNDRLFGGRGDDILLGGRGNDQLRGDAGDDHFLFHVGDGADKILDFASGDVLELDRALWDGELTRKMVIAEFASVTKAGVLFDFGDGDSVLLKGVTDLHGLRDDLLLF